MKELASSPNRHTFQKEGYIQRALEAGKTLDDPEVQAMIKFYDDWKARAEEIDEDPDWQQDNLEHALRGTRWIIEKARASDTYAQHIYAALCNIRWQKRDILPILKDQYWSCSWRSAGGIVADILGRGDYIDWYCSGIGEGLGNGDADGTKGYVPESVVTKEIEDDFYKLGWVHSEWPEDDV
jgi:hypothetical protein